jgi:hypothetical protein
MPYADDSCKLWQMIDWRISFLVDNNGVWSWRHISYAKPHPRSSDSLTNHLLLVGRSCPRIQITAVAAGGVCNIKWLLYRIRTGKLLSEDFSIHSGIEQRSIALEFSVKEAKQIRKG